MTHPNDRLIDASREARTLSPEARSAKEAREDRAAKYRAQMDRAARVPEVEGEGPGMVGDCDE